jgi:hypothetical protein
VAKTAQGLKGNIAKKEVCFAIESWIFTFCFCSWFYMMSSSIRLLGYKYERFEFFQKSLKVPWYWNFEQ